MRFLIALLGDRLDSLVAKNFEHAAWYMIVDGETDEGETTRNITPQDRQKMLREAASANVDAVIAGKFSEHSRRLIGTYKMGLIQVHGMTGRMAMMKAQTGELKQSGLAEGEMKDEKEITLGAVKRPLLKAKKPKMPFTNPGYSSDSPRGHHHIQQYGGRGH